MNRSVTITIIFFIVTIFVAAPAIAGPKAFLAKKAGGTILKRAFLPIAIGVIAFNVTDQYTKLRKKGYRPAKAAGHAASNTIRDEAKGYAEIIIMTEDLIVQKRNYHQNSKRR